MRTMCSREIFKKKCRQQQIFDSDLKRAWHYNHVTFTPIAKNFMLYCRLIYMLSILFVRLAIKVKVGIPESFKLEWSPPPKKKNWVESPFLWLFPPWLHFTTMMEHFIPWPHLTTVMERFIPWYHFTAVIWLFLPWFHFNTVMWHFLPSRQWNDIKVENVTSPQ